MELLDAILNLSKAAESRRASRRALREAINRIDEHLTGSDGELRVGDAVTVNGRHYTVTTWTGSREQYDLLHVACALCDAVPLGFGVGPCPHGVDQGYLHTIAPGSDAERAVFARHATEIIQAFAALHKTEAETFANAAAQAQTDRI